jgi:hypothetical protein
MNFRNFNANGTGKPKPIINVFAAALNSMTIPLGKSMHSPIPDTIIVSPITFQGLKAQLTVPDEYVPPAEQPKKVKGKFKYAAGPAYPGAK